MDNSTPRFSSIMLINTSEPNTNSRSPDSIISQYSKIIRQHVEDLGGTIIENSASATLADFPDTISAVHCAVGLVREITNLGGTPLPLKITVHCGDVQIFEHGVAGSGIEVAQLLQHINAPGQICLSGDVYDLVKYHFDSASLKEIGQITLKTIDREITAWQLSLPETAETVQDRAAEKAAVVSADDALRRIRLAARLRGSVQRPPRRRRLGLRGRR